MWNIDFRPIVYFFIAVGVCIGLAIGGLVYGGCKIADKYDIKIEKIK